LSKFITYINGIYPISDALQERLEQDLEVIELPKRHHLLREGERCDYGFFVIEGLLRYYYIKDDEEICSRFITENHIGISINSFYTRRPGYENIETLEPSLIARMHYDKLQKIYRDHIEFNYIARVWTEHYSSMTEHWFYLLRKQTAEERYLFFLDKYPTLLQRIPLTYIASYLGMNLETLSRIRKKISR